MPEKIVRLATYSNPIDAEMVKNYLENAGITVFSAGSEAPGAFAGLDSAFASVELHVPESQFQQAVEALESFDEQESAVEREISAEDDNTAIMEGEPERPASKGEANSQIRSGPPAGELAGEELDEELAGVPSQDVHADSSEETDPSIEWTPDALATRAWRASFVGLIILPLASFIGLAVFPLLVNAYSVWLLIRMAGLNEEISPAGLWKVYGAIIIDALVLIAAALIVLAMLGRA